MLQIRQVVEEKIVHVQPVFDAFFSTVGDAGLAIPLGTLHENIVNTNDR